eukprot:3717358-Alexandrium_andersonii.AAC.1
MAEISLCWRRVCTLLKPSLEDLPTHASSDEMQHVLGPKRSAAGAKISLVVLVQSAVKHEP